MERIVSTRKACQTSPWLLSRIACMALAPEGAFEGGFVGFVVDILMVFIVLVVGVLGGLCRTCRFCVRCGRIIRSIDVVGE